MTANTLARLKITLDDVKPEVLRRIVVPLDIQLNRLHLTIQVAMGWTNSHLYEFRLGKIRWGEPGLDGDWEDNPLDASKMTLADMIEAAGTKPFKYVYDFGDGWEHTIKAERQLEFVPGDTITWLVDAKRSCPPEDVGGPYGYAEFLEAIADPKNDRHDELLEWAGPNFDPGKVDKKRIESQLESLAKSWSKKPKAKRSPKK